MDRQELFLHPINRTEVPDYYEVVKEPMCWLFIDDKIEKNKYLNVEQFKVGFLIQRLEIPFTVCSATSILFSTTLFYTMPPRPPLRGSPSESKATPSRCSTSWTQFRYGLVSARRQWTRTIQQMPMPRLLVISSRPLYF